ncbi:hypothetical protein SELMODRAFT_118824 [Selaginella moellendorffii]|uniref:Protein arginine N-methyltransferase 2 n=1 Tax=Selaginella moellendorffii TaxID=88036 RepID=D8SJZ4_SELML|nr:protein arginine N-methyltransferase 2 isoform X4 [Selaginella moellendorffii]XP_024544619.1 protein arginine N-methyltransferase 2 isoform X4 [Selaginella moellendorffii]EFJ15138.1 hypothetical protein SELMODRAFT_118824 [Selaginella moellendorffii]|eukprot:XP_002983642.1 protein arginine N-methyltransferase 2 isoform X4 [Selaginella moellendorffii]
MDALLDTAARGDATELRELIRAGGDASYANPSTGLTPLIAAAKAGHSEVVRVLLNAGAPWNALDRSGRCAGDYAMDAGHQDCYDILLDAGVKAELVLGAASRQTTKNSEFSNKDYLEARLSFSEGKLVNEESEGVMMAWERPLMEAHAKAVCCGGDDILNVGFGMGLVDTAIQSYNPSSHTIIEAHPDVYARMISTGWKEKANVRIVFGRWQDVISELGQYDGIFFDTYGEYYEDMREFHSQLPKLLKPGGIYSYFNGLCGHNAFFHVVYCQLVALELAQIGLTTQFIPLPVRSCLDEKTWEGVREKYWQLDTYFLPAAQAEEETDN